MNTPFCVFWDFSKDFAFTQEFSEEISGLDDFLMEKFLNGEKVEVSDISRLVSERSLFPCVFGSALKLEGVDQLLEILNTYFSIPEYKEDFGCTVYKISKDKQGNRLTHLKVTGGILKVKEYLDSLLGDLDVERLRSITKVVQTMLGA